MTEQTIGTARLDLVVTTDKLEAAVESAKRSVSSMSAAAQAEYNKLNAAEKRRVDSYLKQANSINLTRQEQILFNAALKGTPTHILDELKNKLATSGASAQGLTKAFSGTNKSARELQFAMRGLPAQVTDIFTSLASGQRPMMVLLQQGGQLKDMFGGIAPAARALGGAISGLINPLTIAIGVVAGLGAAWKSAQDEMRAFNLAIIQTGGFAGHTADDLKAMAGRLDETTGATQRFASTVIAQVEATGRFTGQQVETVSTAITNMAKATQAAGGDANKAIQDLTKSFSDLSKDPVEALLKLNETQHFLTQSTLDQVQSLVQQGKQAEAAEVAINALADTTNTRAKQMEGSLNSVNAVWRDMKGAIGEAWDETVGFFRDADQQMQQFLRNNEKAVRIASGLTRTFNPFAPNIADSLIDNAKVTPEPIMIGFKRDIDSARARRNIKEAEEAQREWNSSIRQGESDAARLKRELDEVAEAGKRLKKPAEEIKAAQDAIRASFARKAPKGGRGGSDGVESATSRAAIQAIQDQLKQEQGLLQNQQRLLEANYSARNITTEKYYAEQKRLAQEGSAAQVRALEAEVAALSSRNLKGKDSINNARELAQKEAELAKVRADGATALEVLNIQEAAQLKQRQQANIAYQDALAQGQEALQAEMDSMVLRVSVGEREFEIRSRLIQLYRDEAKELLNLARQRDAGEIDPETYKQRVDQLRNAIAEEVKIVQQGYDAMAAAQMDWSNGALKAFEDYRDAANDVAGQTYSLFTDAFSGLEDLAVDFFTKGKADWKGFFDDIAAQIIRFSSRQLLGKLFEKFMPGQQKDGDSASALTGAASSLAASATPLYGAAAALSASATALAAAGVGDAVSGSTDTGGGGWASGISSIIGLFSGNLFAKGGAFSGGVQAFATGGVVNDPTFFPMRGRMGLMGENGPEGILPLKRTSSGDLGVQVASNSQRPVVNNHTTFYVPDLSSRRNQQQVADRTQRLQSRATARN